ncbi:MAG: phosphoglucosamine mutase [Saccharofermentanales bacterium]|jgi:phosphoglucosamine mutase
MSRLFGTDGVRGVANRDLTPELAYLLGFAGAHVLTEETRHKPTIVVGEDTRVSCGMLGSALIAGITCAGADVLHVGVIPTPGVAWLTRRLRADAGIMISASHNSFEYNGIKFFSGGGFKLPDETEDAIEALINDSDFLDEDRPTGEKIGKLIRYDQGADEYREHLQSIAGLDLTGMTIVVDCAHGASYAVAPKLFNDLGADVIAVGVNPNGYNINHECGSTHVEKLSSVVREYHAHIGLAFDGDADRLIAVDDQGDICNGDVMLAILARDLDRQGKLTKKAIVATVMSNLGLEHMTNAAGYELIRTQVGDRYVLERMLADGYVLGGEQSGHIILLENSTTGDGVLTAIRLLSAIRNEGKGALLSEMRKIMTTLPQIIVNAHVPDELKQITMNHCDVTEAIKEKENVLGSDGRIVVRPSGTEPLIRVMIEGVDQTQITDMAHELREVIETVCATFSEE